MDKKVIFAVAGSGKTTHIIHQIDPNQKILIVTYTLNNLKNLRDGIVERFGYFPDSITLQSYFTFLYSFCFRPFLPLKFVVRGIEYEKRPLRGVKLTDAKYFFDGQRKIYVGRIAKFLEVRGVLGDVNARLSKYFDTLFIDEVQDLAGQDFNFLKSICRANLKITAVGDFYQHTFDTSRDATVNANLHDNYDKYRNAFAGMGFAVDTESLNKSFRCSPTVCRFITANIGIEIHSHRADETKVHFIETQEEADEVFQNRSIVKLFYQQHSSYACYSENWGGCKGENRYHDVCVVLNKTTLSKYEEKLRELQPQTMNKLYVACTRARNDLYFVSDCFYKKHKT
jgi:DNA helicase II / ATP-dependent DNA helicase PcrA